MASRYMQQDTDPDGAQLAAVEAPLEEGAKLLQVLREHSGSFLRTHLLGFEVCTWLCPKSRDTLCSCHTQMRLRALVIVTALPVKVKITLDKGSLVQLSLLRWFSSYTTAAFLARQRLHKYAGQPNAPLREVTSLERISAPGLPPHLLVLSKWGSALHPYQTSLGSFITGCWAALTQARAHEPSVGLGSL